MFKSIIFSSLVLIGANLTMIPVMAQTQDPPAETFQPGFWQPVARVDINKPISINIINETGFALNYALTDASLEPTVIEVDGQNILKNIQPPTYIVIYPDSKIPNSSRMSLKYFVEVTSDNTVELRVKQIENVSLGNRTFNLQRTGAIFLY
ncbi:MAG: hypothetical protein GW795_04165 [Cyanobacteria bacterium]|nr:hypothetical protein [Cyanobacteria bacterium CG_2015-16_32_12]NCO77285.1 hypothetical protein [Cyanobacteria bacterium CG_2015-22_32_23]NCQ05753.1 hypothetical protein [Cyanobacteria bacterium CG_2015-09_32_10]NCQ41090.1 hypothetical protein [Cyanobacteria bacterium CG_2015-04_32_10]NCS86163.1 hypothetical protein [Cyanobacteria bacterium CG_2015-02_32_10]